MKFKIFILLLSFLIIVPAIVFGGIFTKKEWDPFSYKLPMGIGAFSNLVENHVKSLGIYRQEGLRLRDSYRIYETEWNGKKAVMIVGVVDNKVVLVGLYFNFNSKEERDSSLGEIFTVFLDYDKNREVQSIFSVSYWSQAVFAHQGYYLVVAANNLAIDHRYIGPWCIVLAKVVN